MACLRSQGECLLVLARRIFHHRAAVLQFYDAIVGFDDVAFRCYYDDIAIQKKAALRLPTPSGTNEAIKLQGNRWRTRRRALRHNRSWRRRRKRFPTLRNNDGTLTLRNHHRGGARLEQTAASSAHLYAGQALQQF